MHAVFAVQLRVKFLFAANLLCVEEDCRTPRSGRNAAEVFNDNHDGRLLIYLSFCQIMPFASLDRAEKTYCKAMGSVPSAVGSAEAIGQGNQPNRMEACEGLSRKRHCENGWFRGN